ncbi:MAG: bile acid:sodium symporter family protein [Pirellulaceae bacterium]|nr:bile acid:sodium symporter family protein [Pirellulaceae bacterium]
MKMGRIALHLQRFLLPWLIVLSLGAFVWPSVVPARIATDLDPFVASRPCLPVLIFATMFAIGSMLPREEVDQVLRRWPFVLAGSALQYTAMPFLAFGVGRIWQLEGDLLVGLMMVGCVPGAMASNVLTLHARGNTSYSVSLTTVATLLSPLVVPLALRFTLVGADALSSQALWRASFLLLLTVVLPVTLGHLMIRVRPQWQATARILGSILANLVILWVIAVVVGLNRERLAAIQFSLFLALLALNALGYLAGYWGGWSLKLREPMRRALTLEVGMQNAGLGATLATQLFPDRDGTALAPALYTFGCMLTGTLLAQWWSGRKPQSET